MRGGEELRQEGGEEQEVLRVARTEAESLPEHAAEARVHRLLLGSARLAGNARFLPALPGEIEQVERTDHLEHAEQLLRGQQQGAEAEGRGAEQADRRADPAEERRQRAAQAVVQAVADHQQRQRAGDQDHDQGGAAEQQPGFQVHC
ncbi:hypothetical protein D9M71_664180 [compost metagenome]